MVVGKELLYLGDAVELCVEERNGDELQIRFRKGKHGLFCNHKGTAIYILPLASRAKIALPPGREKGKALWRGWSKMNPAGAFNLNIPDGAKTLFKRGQAVEILYDSDKWAKKQTYIHKFIKNPPTYSDRKKSPRVWGMLATDGSRLVNARGIVG